MYGSFRNAFRPASRKTHTDIVAICVEGLQRISYRRPAKPYPAMILEPVRVKA